jgi:formylglycine-generating enzyme required for sulfatase activity
VTSKFALVIANTEYQDASFAKLTGPGKDAEEFAQVLRDAELAAFEDVQVLLNEGESKIRRSIARFFTDRKRDDLLLLYFSGHGIRNGQGQLFLAANDTESSILEATGIPADFITYAMNNSRSQRQLLILDCCNSGAFAHGSKSASAVGKSMGIATAFEGSGFGRVVLTATDATQYAWEGDKVIGNTQKSVFTHFLIEGLQGDADRDGDGRIHVDELYDYAYEQVVRRTPKQTPGKWSYKQQGDIILRDNLKPRDVKPAPLPSDLLEVLTHPSSFVRSSGVQELIRLLDGKHLGLARASEEKLREIAANDDSLTLRKTASDTLIAHGIQLEQTIDILKESPPAVQPPPVETPKKEHKDEKKVKKPVLITPLPIGEERVMEKTPWLAPERKKVFPNIRLIGGIAGALVIITLCVWAGLTIVNNWPFSNPTITATENAGVSVALTLEAETMQAQITQAELTSSPTQSSILPTPTPSLDSTMSSDKDNMTLVYVPAGKFTMGDKAEDALAECQKFRSDCQLDWFKDEAPPHEVDLKDFWIDQIEVTNEMFAKCVQDGACNQPSDTTYYDDSNYANHPVVYVSWTEANAYCSWADRRLPTETEWEKAARGENALIYPWGNEFDGTRTNFCDKNCSYDWANKSFDDGFSDTSPVGNYQNGASPYDALDMAGNVWEWVSSLYKPYPYSATDGREDLSASGDRVLRGGSWFNYDSNVRSSDRGWDNPTDTFNLVGFRCSRSP